MGTMGISDARDASRTAGTGDAQPLTNLANVGEATYTAAAVMVRERVRGLVYVDMFLTKTS
jgi:hypothetical protein